MFVNRLNLLLTHCNWLNFVLCFSQKGLTWVGVKSWDVFSWLALHSDWLRYHQDYVIWCCCDLTREMYVLGTSGSLSNVIIFCLQYVYSGWKRLFQSTGYRYMLERSMPKQGADFMRTVKSVCVHSLSASELSTLALSMNKLLLIYIYPWLCAGSICHCWKGSTITV